MTIIEDAVSLLGKIISVFDNNEPDEPKFEQLRKQAQRQHGHLIGKPVIWVNPSGLVSDGIAMDIEVCGDGNTWLRVKYWFPSYDDPKKLIESRCMMLLSSYLLPIEDAGLEWSIENVSVLPKAA